MQLDQDIGAELLDACHDLCSEVETDLDKLARNTGGDLHALFRHVHTVKGNAAIVGLVGIVDFTHSLEEVFGALRANKFSATKLLCQALQLGIDRIRDLHQREIHGQHFDNLYEEELKALFLATAEAKQEDIDSFSTKILNVGSEEPEAVQINEPVLLEPDDTQLDSNIVCLTRSGYKTKAGFDLHFFRELAKQVDRQSRYWEGRTEQLNNWAQRLNEMRDCLVDPDQLAAAVYMHDIGMCYIPNSIIEKDSTLTDEERKELEQHPIWGCNYLLRIQGWEPAATMVLEHHERIDGKGYPLGNKGEVIHEGSKLLAVVDAFFSITNHRADRAQRKTTIKAISEINSCVDTQFDQEWVLAFNDLIKSEVRSGNL